MIYLVFAFLISFAIAGFHYNKHLKSKEKVSYLLTFLRFLSIFSILLLLINPEIQSNQTSIEKPKLILLVDNSTSIAQSNQQQQLSEVIQTFESNTELADKFELQRYSFHNELMQFDTLSFDGNQTNIQQSLEELNTIYSKNNAPIVLITDGNQTLGKPYQYYSSNQAVYPLVVGDTTRYEDVAIQQLNTNRFSFLDNNFPVELIINYEGTNNHRLAVSVVNENQKVYSKTLSFSNSNKSAVLSFSLPSKNVGKHYYKVTIETIENEKNTINNSSEFMVEVIDEQAKVLVLSSFLHPDLGALKKSIETNKQRAVEIKMITDEFNLLDYQAVIVYQSTRQFQEVFIELDYLKLGHLIITGPKTDWAFLNRAQSNFNKNSINQTENYSSSINQGFSLFSAKDIDFSSFPPLLTQFGNMTVSTTSEVLLYQQFGTISTQDPKLFFYEDNETRTGVLIGENSWRWRFQYLSEHGNAAGYDAFIGKIIQYLSSSKRNDRLQVDVKSMFNSNERIQFTADFVDENFQFNPNAKLWLTLTNLSTQEIQRLPFRHSGSNFALDLVDLRPGEYMYAVSVEDSDMRKGGSFKVIDFDVEQQFNSANYNNLELLANASQGKLFMLNRADALIEDLINEPQYLPIQRVENKIHSLIDWKWLFAVIVISLSIEWFIRKYRGLI